MMYVYNIFKITTTTTVGFNCHAIPYEYGHYNR